MKIEKEPLIALLKEYQHVLSQYERYSKFIEQRYLQKNGLLKRNYYCSQIHQVTEQYIEYRVEDNQGDWTQSVPITLEEICMDQNTWAQHIAKLDQERLQKQRLAKMKYEQGQKQYRHKQYLKLKQEFEAQ